jgi:transposase
MKASARRRIDVDLEELDQLVDRSMQTPLSASEGQKLKTALHAMAERLMGTRTTEKTNTVLETPPPATESTTANKTAKPAGHGRHAAAAFVGADKVSVPHASLHSGDPCPECQKGKVYLQKEPATLVRFVGQAPLKATVFEMERLRCNACGQVFTAETPEQAGSAKYDETAVAMTALLKYGTGVPFNRLERLEQQLGMPLSATTQWELMEAGASGIRAGWDELIRQAAQGSVVHNDDTGMRILRLAREPSDKRTGTFTTGIISVVGTRRIALYFTGWKHAGENIAEVLKLRDDQLPAPIQMCDALSRNTSKVKDLEILFANCLAHGRRQFVEIADNFPEQCRYVLETLRDVYRNDAVTREQNLSPEDRLQFHQEHSQKLMTDLHGWMEAQFTEHKTEPNSGLGKAFSYLLNHWEKLTLFLKQPGAPLDNNVVERALKKAILNRKNALFYRTENGALVGDLFMSLIHTCELNGVNPFDYLTALLRHVEELKQNPSAWMPWNYRDTLAKLKTPAAA